jgi:hypothetical protein
MVAMDKVILNWTVLGTRITNMVKALVTLYMTRAAEVKV